MKNLFKYSFIAFVVILFWSACNSNRSGDRTADSIDSVNDSIRNDTGSFDITSQRDTTIDTATGIDTSALR